MTFVNTSFVNKLQLLDTLPVTKQQQQSTKGKSLNKYNSNVHSHFGPGNTQFISIHCLYIDSAADAAELP